MLVDCPIDCSENRRLGTDLREEVQALLDSGQRLQTTAMPAAPFDVPAPCSHNTYMEIERRLTVGSRELKTRLGTYLRKVRAGASVIVTDRGRPVAELRPLDTAETPLEARLQELNALGVVTSEVAERPGLEPFEPIRSRRPLSEAISEGREDRF